MATVLMRSKEGPVTFSFDLPNGKKQTIDFKKNGEGDFTAQAPTVITYIDDFKNKKVFHENYAQFLLNAYKYLEVVSVAEAPVIAKVEEEKPRERKKKNAVPKETP